MRSPELNSKILDEMQPIVSELWKVGEHLKHPEAYKYMMLVMLTILTDTVIFSDENKEENWPEMLDMLLRDIKTNEPIFLEILDAKMRCKNG